MSLTDEAADTWQQEAARLREEIDKVDDWANGVYAALRDVLLVLLRSQPDMAGSLAPVWREASERWEAVTRQTGQAEKFHEKAELLEARKMLYRQLVALGLFPAPDGES